MAVIISTWAKFDVIYNLTIAAETASAAEPMREQFLDELGGVRVPPESSKCAGRTKVSSDETVAGEPPDQHGERAVEEWADGHVNEIGNWSDTEGPRRSAAARSTVWPWVVGAAVTALAAVFWVGFSDRGGGQTSSAQMPPPQVTVSKPLARDVDTRIGFPRHVSAVRRRQLPPH